jgi:hypothetical protein
MSPALLLNYSAGRISTDLWWKNQELSPVDIIPPWFSILIIIWEMNNRRVGGSSSET